MEYRDYAALLYLDLRLIFYSVFLLCSTVDRQKNRRTGHLTYHRGQFLPPRSEWHLGWKYEKRRCPVIRYSVTPVGFAVKNLRRGQYSLKNLECLADVFKKQI